MHVRIRIRFCTRTHRRLHEHSYESLHKSVELTAEFQFDEAREAVEDARECLKKLEGEVAQRFDEVERALEHVNAAEEAFFYEKLVGQLAEVS